MSDDQRAELAKPAGAGAAEPKLRFSFRFQRWSDVLEWFAEQANLSLVIDAPPPGTFNYSDNRDYTVSEALDLLNGVLLTKGYTLIRRDRMLTVVNLADGVPEALVPRIDLADLESRGRFRDREHVVSRRQARRRRKWSRRLPRCWARAARVRRCPRPNRSW